MSLYLKYRPSDFTNLVGQSFVKNTLQKAIENDKTVGAYLLCGPRGTGKTSTARILAKTVNCEDPNKGNPCLKCNICIDFLDEKLIDIIEIDAASHTGVDNIREIIEKAQFTPSKTKYKIYIVDEVHMLSKGAFNALLKILEEPPIHVKFILATTETHKVPETIISRCQRYDFKRISDEDIKSRLSHIAKSEKVKIDDKSLDYIIKNASGGLRNAISLFEQLITDSEINYESIVEKLEIVDENVLDEFLNKLLERDQAVIPIFDKVVSDGKNVKLFFRELMFYSKNKALESLKKGESIDKLVKILEILDETYSNTKNSLDENTTLLIGVLKILQNQVSVSMAQIEKNERIKNNVEQQKKVQKEKIEKKTIKEEVVPEISHDDLADVFGDSEESKQKEEPTTISPNTSTNLDVNMFISKLKENGGKGGLTMALRGCTLSLNGEELIIGAKTRIAKGQVENADNIGLILKTLTDLGYTNYQVKTN